MNGPIAPSAGAILKGRPPAPPPRITKPFFSAPSPSISTSSSEKGTHPVPRKPTMGSDTEDALLPRHGEKGDESWRRFSMVTHLEEKSTSGGKGKRSVWLRKTQSGTNRLSKWVWFIGLVLLGAIGAAVGLGVYFTKGDPDHQQPVALSGEMGTQRATATVAAAGTGTGASGSGASTVKHVSPTHTIDARAWVGVAAVTPVHEAELVYRNVNVNVNGVEGMERRETQPCPKATATAPFAARGEEEGRARREHLRSSVSRKRRF